MYALLEIKGHQFKAEKGKYITVDLMHEEQGSKIELSNVLLLSDGEKTAIGHPYIEGASVLCSVEEEDVRGKKFYVFKHKKRKNYRRKQGHLQHYTKLRIEEIKGSIA